MLPLRSGAADLRVAVWSFETTVDESQNFNIKQLLRRLEVLIILILPGFEFGVMLYTFLIIHPTQ